MNIFLNHLEKKAKADETLRGIISPAWQENHIAKKHGEKGLEGVGANVKKHLTGDLRVVGRSLVEGAAGGWLGRAAGAAAGKLAKKDPRTAAALGAMSGYYAGAVHGQIKSLKNQAAEAHAKYSGQEKKAAYDQLIEAGLNFDEAIGLIKAAEQDLK